MAEQYANNPTPAATLASGINNSVTSLSISSATGFPGSGTFRIRIDDEIIIVGAISGTTLSTLTRGAEGTTGASHSSGATVNIVLTAASLLSVPTSSYFNRTNPVTGRSWSWVNQTSAVLTTGVNSIQIVGTGLGSNNHQGRYITAPATPYIAIFGIQPMHFGGIGPFCGAYFRDSVGGKLSALIAILNAGANGVTQLSGINYDSPTVQNAVLTLTYKPVLSTGGPFGLAIGDDGTNRNYYYSPDGEALILVYTEASNTRFTADQIGFGVDTDSSSVVPGISLFSLTTQ